MSRNGKRVVIILIYLVIFSLIAFSVYLAVAKRPTCTDGKKNQSEEGVDCGGPCAPCKKEIIAKDLEIKEQVFVYGGRQDVFDALVKISNPNNDYGASSFHYLIQLVDQKGVVLAQKDGESFILPKESKYIIEQNLQATGKPYAVNVEISNLKWQKFLNFQSEPQLMIYNKQYTEFDDKNTLFALLKNESYFDFNSIEIDIVLRDDKGKPLAVGKNEMRTVNAGEQRDIKMIWPYKFHGNVSKVDVKAEANVFDSNNFRKKYFPEQRFQQYE